MREIKFRAWDGKKMDYDCRDSLSIWNGILVPEGDHVPMQFTGLKDKNGREIYEGDLLRRPGFDSVWAVVWWQVGFYKHNQNAGHAHIDKDQEVIGNIHENPELFQ